MPTAKQDCLELHGCLKELTGLSTSVVRCVIERCSKPWRRLWLLVVAGSKIIGKGDTRRPTLISREEEQRRWEEVFGPPKIKTVMSDEERAEMEAEKARLIAETEAPDGE